ncbi:flavin reductase family protein [Paraclostridium bifermentans]|uniref:flavin reductase family protein n=1 Tax=Paraclostridium bifermentans TaxID=1490 RepID=UPI001C122280|nr:flavin reductase family protein [Paraclostridium bifermentans]MBS5953604.1 flavin reductase family protein [Paraclostridium bifermentans]MBU5288681.1 flavin reductase family protein [Paraclostridium bifermentans]
MKREIEVFDYAGEIMKGIKSGVLLTTKAEDKVNTMTISWGTLGIEWNKPIFTVFVRENRFTKEQLDKNPQFTINIPVGEFDKKILGVCGTKSGRNVDKISELNLTLEESNNISVPGIKELPLTLECRVIYKQEQDKNAITEENKKTFYPQDVDSSYHGANNDFHTAYYGEIIGAYIIEE